jgi:exportin-T
VDAWGGSGVATPVVNGNGITPHTHVVGFERFIYERVVPLVFQIPSHPSCNPKDGQTLVVRIAVCFVF